jgi:hypothetical protein
MTTHDEQTKITTTSSADADPAAPRESASTETEPSATETDLPTTDDTPADASPPQQEQPASGEDVSTPESDAADTPSESAVAEHEEHEAPADEPLFADGTLSGLRSRWDDVQAAFVDDPKECVQKADALVARVVDQLTTGFSEARTRLEAQWDRGEEASTEDLRVALKRYREFFERLLSV